MAARELYGGMGRLYVAWCTSYMTVDLPAGVWQCGYGGVLAGTVSGR
jgi:hypothetical protein